MDFVVAQLAVLLLPGIIWAKIDARYGAGSKPDQTTLILRSFLFGLATYTVLFIIYACAGWDFGYALNSKNVDRIDLSALGDEIVSAVVLSFGLSVVWLWSVQYRWMMKILHLVGATRRFGDEDVWTFTLNSRMAEVEYVHVRDIQNGYIFSGWINAYSENDALRELLLKDAIVYNDAGVEISQAPHLYLSRSKDNIWIEFPYRKASTDGKISS